MKSLPIRKWVLNESGNVDRHSNDFHWPMRQPETDSTWESYQTNESINDFDPFFFFAAAKALLALERQGRQSEWFVLNAR